MADKVTITHPDIKGAATVIASSLSVWEAKGWSVADEDAVEAVEVEEEVVDDSQPEFDWDEDGTVDDDEDVADE